MSYSNVKCCCCQKNFEKPNKEIRKSKTGNHFCSRSCAVTHNNQFKSKRLPEGFCKICNDSISKSLTYCKDCYIIFLENQRKPKQKCELCNKPSRGTKCINCYKESISKHNLEKICIDCNCQCTSKRCRKCYNAFVLEKSKQLSLKDCIYDKHHKSSAFAKIRSQARSIAKKQGWTKCCKCGYDKHIEIAHKKPISDFSLETPVSEINSINNLLPLCPNCHWEFDNL